MRRQLSEWFQSARTAEIAMLISPHLPYIPERADRILEAYRTDRPKDKGESLTDE